MLQYIPVIGPAITAIPHILIDASLILSSFMQLVAIAIYTALPLSVKHSLIAIFNHSDLFLLAFLLILINMSFTPLAKPATVSKTFVALLCWALSVSTLLYLFNIIASHQYAHFLKNPALPISSQNDFIPIFPPDFQIELTYISMIDFLDHSGTVGRTAYAYSLIVDLFCILSYTHLHSVLFSLFEYKGNDVPLYIYILQTRLPFVVAALDLYENLCFAAMLYWYSSAISNQPSSSSLGNVASSTSNSDESTSMSSPPSFDYSSVISDKVSFGSLSTPSSHLLIDHQFSPSFVKRAGLATAMKFMAVYLLLGLQVAGIGRYFIYKFEKRDAGEKSNGGGKSMMGSDSGDKSKMNGNVTKSDCKNAKRRINSKNSKSSVTIEE